MKGEGRNPLPAPSARQAYLDGAIDEAELERRLEAELREDAADEIEERVRERGPSVLRKLAGEPTGLGRGERLGISAFASIIVGIVLTGVVQDGDTDGPVWEQGTLGVIAFVVVVWPFALVALVLLWVIVLIVVFNRKPLGW